MHLVCGNESYTYGPMWQNRELQKEKKHVLISQDVVGDPETEIIDIIAFFCLCDEVKIPVSVLYFLALKKICR